MNKQKQFMNKQHPKSRVIKPAEEVHWDQLEWLSGKSCWIYFDAFHIDFTFIWPVCLKRIPHARHQGRFTEQEAESFNEVWLKSKEQKADEDPTRTDE